MDALADRLTSRDITDWMAYYQAVHEIGLEAAEAAGRPPLDGGDLRTPDGPTRQPMARGFIPLDEAALRAKFRAHNARLGL